LRLKLNPHKSFSAILFSMFWFSAPNTSDLIIHSHSCLGQTKPSIYISVFLSYYKNFYCQVVFQNKF